MSLHRCGWIAGIIWLFSFVTAKPPTHINGAHFDYVILGGGTAGIVVASRLSEDPKITVAVVEAGDFERNNPNVTNASIIALGVRTHVDWQYESAPQIFAGNRSLVWSAGKGVGGSSLINGKSDTGQVSRDADGVLQE